MTKADKPAFPRPATEDSGYENHKGMTMREWYAGMAMQGILAAHAGAGVAMPEEVKLAKDAFGYADAMLAQSQKGTP